MANKLLTCLLLVCLFTSSLQIQINFEDLFGGGGGGFFQGGQQEEHQEGQGAHEETHSNICITLDSLPLAPGYPCKTGEVVSNPYDCPCPMSKMTKCRLDDWYTCVPPGTKVVRIRISKLTQ